MSRILMLIEFVVFCNNDGRSQVNFDMIFVEIHEYHVRLRMDGLSALPAIPDCYKNKLIINLLV